MYLIVKCEEYGEQIDSTPMFMTDDWERDGKNLDYQFEVWESVNGKFELIRRYDECFEFGMAYGYWDNEEIFHCLRKFPGKTRNEGCPKKIRKMLEAKGEIEDCLFSCGYISTCYYDIFNNNIYCYTEYEDNRYWKCW